MRLQQFGCSENGRLDLRTALFGRRIRGLPAQEFRSADDDLKLVINFVEKFFGNLGIVVVWHGRIVAHNLS